MTKISKSPERHTFQKTGYIKRQTEAGESISEDYLDMFDKIIIEHAQKFIDPDSHENNMEYDLLTTDWILEKTRTNDAYAQNLYAAMCNNDFQKNEFMPLLAGKTWSCSWRYAGGIIADMQQRGDYIDWYCSGIRGDIKEPTEEEWDSWSNEEQQHYTERNKFVSESVVTDEIRADLKRLGWAVTESNDK